MDNINRRPCPPAPAADTCARLAQKPRQRHWACLPKLRPHLRRKRSGSICRCGICSRGWWHVQVAAARPLQCRLPGRSLQGNCRVILQKYWHKGAFFQSEGDAEEAVLGDIMHRDYNAPTGEDKFDKEMLPKIMQARGLAHCAAQGATSIRCATLGGAGAPSGLTCWRRTPACRPRRRCPHARQATSHKISASQRS